MEFKLCLCANKHQVPGMRIFGCDIMWLMMAAFMVVVAMMMNHADNMIPLTDNTTDSQ
jgi:hypothetical protein